MYNHSIQAHKKYYYPTAIIYNQAPRDTWNEDGGDQDRRFYKRRAKKKKRERNVMGIRATARSWGECKGALSGQKKKGCTKGV
jgi:hypothetical protein